MGLRNRGGNPRAGARARFLGVLTLVRGCGPCRGGGCLPVVQ